MKWNIDQAHSAIGFSVRHLGIATVRGRFREFGGFLETGRDGQPLSLEVTIEAASVDTNQADRDRHLRSADFFDAERYPRLSFRSTAIRSAGPGGYDIAGDLTIRGVTRPVRFSAEAAQALADPWGNRRLAGEASGVIDRREWGLVWNQLLETGGFMVSDEVKFHLEIEAVAEVSQQAAA
jgi:polyisoprenoid-binding protein YceI